MPPGRKKIFIKNVPADQIFFFLFLFLFLLFFFMALHRTHHDLHFDGNFRF